MIGLREREDRSLKVPLTWLPQAGIKAPENPSQSGYSEQPECHEEHHAEKTNRKYLQIGFEVMRHP